jgi:glycolate oxidase FAD binding subunit
VDWAGALRWLRSSAPASAVRAAARRAGGSAALWHGDGVEPMFDTLPEPMLRIQRRLKERFDPAGVFNHGRLIRGL